MITIMKNQLMAEQYEELLQVTSDRICLRFCDRRMIIQGKDLKVLALTRDEILIEGKMEGMQFHEEA